MRTIPLLCALVAVIAAPLAAQVGLPGLPLPRLDRVLPPLVRPVEDVAESATRLARERVRALDRLVRRESAAIPRGAASFSSSSWTRLRSRWPKARASRN